MARNSLIDDIRAEAVRVRTQARLAKDQNMAFRLEEYAKDCDDAADRLSRQLPVKKALSG